MSEISILNGYKIKDKKAVRYYDTISNMKSDTTLKAGMYVKTKGYYSINDGGNAEYYITDTESLTLYQEELTGGLYATLIINDILNIKQIGAYGNGVNDDTTVLKSALTYSDVVYLPLGTYLISDEITINSSKTIMGCVTTAQAYGTTIITEYTGSLFKVTYKNCNFKNLYIENVSETLVDTQIGIKLDNSTPQSNTEITNVFIKKFYIGLDNYRFYDITVSNCRFTDCEYGVRVIEGTTSNKFEKCWCINCTNGYYFKKTNYSELNNCYSDSCTNPYYIDECYGLSLISCGCEMSVNTPIQITYGNVTIIGFYGYRNNSSSSNNADFIYISGYEGNISRSILNVIGCDIYNLNSSSTATNSIVCRNSNLNGYGSTLRKDISIDDNSKFNISYNTDGGLIFRNNIENRYNYGSVLSGTGNVDSNVVTGTININKNSPMAEFSLNLTTVTEISQNTKIGTISSSNLRIKQSKTTYAQINKYFCALYVNTSGDIYLRPVESTIPTGTNLVGNVLYFNY
jgi:hypothetical protein